MLLGGSMSYRTVGGAIRPIVIGVLGKLVILPMVFLPLSIWMGYRDIELITLMVLYGAPAAVASYTMAQQMEADGDLAAQLVVFGSAFSVLTMFIMIFSLKQLGFI
jgi:predicted permease